MLRLQITFPLVGIFMCMIPATALADYHMIRTTTCGTYTKVNENPSYGANLLEDCDPEAGPCDPADRSSLHATSAYVNGYCDLKLPEGAQISRLTAYGHDNALNEEIIVHLRKSRYNREIFTVIAEVRSQMGANTWSVDVDPPETVQNNWNTYYFYFLIPANIPDDLRIWTIEVYYSVPAGAAAAAGEDGTEESARP